jgi:outer membrane protein TolC
MKMRTFLYIISLHVVLFAGSLSFEVQGQSSGTVTKSVQSGDSLSLSQILQTVIQSHPTIKEAEEAVSVADAKIGLAKSGYYPKVDATASYSRIGPAPTIDFPSLGSFQLYPNDNYSASVNYDQVLYDFGKTKKNVGLENENKAMAEKGEDLAKQHLSLLTANTFYNLVYLQEAIRINERELQILQDHLEFVKKKKATGSATQYEYLTVKVRLSVTENQKLDLETMQKIQLSVLRSLMGLPVTTTPTVKQDFSILLPSIAQDSLLAYAYSHRLEMDLAKEKEVMAGLQYQLDKAQNNPELSVFASGGGKNGYIPDLNVVKMNYVAGVGLRIPIFDGNRKKNNLLISKSAVNNSQYDTELERRNITNEVVESEANRTAALQKIKQNELQVEQAEEAFALAKVNYSTGAITNLDLLDAENVVSESRLMLLKSKIDYESSVFRLNISLGNKMY